jgi:excisionase family DNA binding protein
LTPAHVARRLAVSERTIRYWAEVGELPGFKIGNGHKLWRFDSHAIENYVKSREGSSQLGDDDTQDPPEELSATPANAAPPVYTFQITKSQSDPATGNAPSSGKESRREHELKRRETKLSQSS